MTAGLSLLVHGISIVLFWFILDGLGSPASFGGLATAVPVLLLATTLPISIAGWGVREGIAVLLFGTIGVPSDAALAASLAFGAVLLIAALPGAAVLVVLASPTAGEHELPQS